MAARKTAFSPTFRVPSQPASSSSVAAPIRNQIALLWMMSSRPNADSVRSIMVRTSALTPTSVRAKMAVPPAAAMPSTTCCPRSASTSATQTDAPSRASSSAVAWPMPDAAPVTMAALPATRPPVPMSDSLPVRLQRLSQIEAATG